MKTLLVHGMWLLIAFLGTAGNVAGQTYPARTIRFIIPYPAGGATDVFSRVVAQKLSEATGQAVVVDNRAGAGGMLGTDVVAKAPGDGYTIGLAHAGPLAINPSLYKKLPYDPIRDLAPISLMGEQQNTVVVHPSLPVKSIRELIGLAKARPGEIAMGSGGSGTGSHLAGEMFVSMTQVKMLHVPYKGNAPSVIALVSGEVQVMFPTILTVKPHVAAGRLRALAVTTAKRVSAMPALPTVAEAGVPGYESSIWFGVMAPAHTPKNIVTRLNDEIVRILGVAEFQRHFDAQGLTVRTSTPDEFRALIRSETVKWAKVVKDAGIKAQ